MTMPVLGSILLAVRDLGDAEAFAPYGRLLVPPALPGPLDYSATLGLQPAAGTNFSLKLLKRAASPIPVVPPYLERHPLSEQCFLPMAGCSSYLSLVAGELADGTPDLGSLVAFRVPAPLGVVYRRGVWHGPIAVVGSEALFVTMMWSRSVEADTEKVVTARPIAIAA